MPFVTFTCACKCLFGRYLREGEPWVATCRLCGAEVTDAIGPHGYQHKRSIHSVGDQYDYISPIDGAHISSKRAHRDHLKRHDVIEVGNEKPKLAAFKPSIPRESIRREMKENLERMKSHGTWRER